ncbi:hypothetical protein ILUMI_10550 [Ignelater luminosus]|uniref:Uncharacterized protein n=1 Tax=Ignelater luminosus TaxID=2038154 RepID=A0A8K0D3Q1_IGNLU|nr:hypothetical protein ILUMI_10550 [Ignelater luminosus]
MPIRTRGHSKELQWIHPKDRDNREKTVRKVCISYSIISDMWYEVRRKDQQEKRNEIVESETAAIVEDIKSRDDEVKTYPSSDTFLETK